MCSFLERPDLRIDPSTRAPDGPSPGLRVSLHRAVAEWAATVTPFQAAHRLQGLGLAAGPVQNGEDLWRDAQLRSRGAFVEVVHPDLGRLEYPDAPLSAPPPRGPRTSGPRLGAHTGEVLREWLGCSDSEVRDLEASTAVWLPEASSEPPAC